MFQQKKIVVCEDCFLKFQSLQENEKEKISETKRKVFVKNTGRIAKKVNNRLSLNTETLQFLKRREKSLEVLRTEEIQSQNLMTPTNNKKKWNFKLNLGKSNDPCEYFNSEKSTGRITSSRSRELTERYSNSKQCSEYFTEENSKFLYGMLKTGVFLQRNLKFDNY